MPHACPSKWWSIFVVLIASAAGFAQAEHQSATLVVNGRSGKAATLQLNGHTYVDLAALAQIGDGSVSFAPDRIILTLAASGSAVEVPKTPDDTTLSREFMKAAFEEIALLREWGAAVGYAIQNGYPIQEQWAANYREQAANGLRLASVAASTNGDKSAEQLLSSEFDGVRQWSDRLVQASQKMNTAKYSMSPNALRDEPDTQKLIACWHSLGSMLGSGTFQDDGSCR